MRKACIEFVITLHKCSFAPCFTVQVHTNIALLPAFHNAVVTIGTFDGVHKGHREILARLTQAAADVNGQSVLISFHPHPRQVIAGTPTPLLNTLEEKTALLQQLGIHHLVLVPFTTQFAAQSPTEYVEEFLIKRFHPHTVIIGYDHRFGKERQGDFRLLEDYAAKGHFQLLEIPPQLISNTAISSTRIRKALQEGDVEAAQELLGYPYFFSGTVIKGNQLGRTIGYPTANLQLQEADKLVPANGVYITSVLVEGEPLMGMMNIGTRPTVDGSKMVIEVHLLDFDRDIYGAVLTVQVLKPVRKEQKFPSLDALKEQLGRDKALTRQYFT